MEKEEDDRLRFSRRPAAFTRIGEGAADADAAGWPADIRGGIWQAKKRTAACGG
jgi:hypothetical protein